MGPSGVGREREQRSPKAARRRCARRCDRGAICSEIRGESGGIEVIQREVVIAVSADFMTGVEDAGDDRGKLSRDIADDKKSAPRTDVG